MIGEDLMEYKMIKCVGCGREHRRRDHDFTCVCGTKITTVESHVIKQKIKKLEADAQRTTVNGKPVLYITDREVYLHDLHPTQMYPHGWEMDYRTGHLVKRVA